MSLLKHICVVTFQLKIVWRMAWNNLYWKKTLFFYTIYNFLFKEMSKFIFTRYQLMLCIHFSIILGTLVSRKETLPDRIRAAIKTNIRLFISALSISTNLHGKSFLFTLTSLLKQQPVTSVSKLIFSSFINFLHG